MPLPPDVGDDERPEVVERLGHLPEDVDPLDRGLLLPAVDDLEGQRLTDLALQRLPLAVVDRERRLVGDDPGRHFPDDLGVRRERDTAERDDCLRHGGLILP